MKNKKLSKKANKIVQNIESFIEDNNDFSSDKYLYQNDLKIVLSNIERIKKEFESSMFFLVASGAIKSGKSTLINLLADNKEVSTTKQGKETTLRPAIICKGEQDSIFLFNTTKSTVTNDTNDFKITELNDLAIDFIKGFINEKDLNEKYKIKIIKKDFTKDNIAKYLTNEIIEGEDEPKLVNIQIKIDPNKVSLLNQDIAIIDTPGIDGILAGAEGLKDNSSKLDLMSRVDLMLFLQSSVTPINLESKQYITKLATEHSITNISLVHNKFTLKPWRKELKLEANSELNNIDEKAINNAKRVFKDLVSDLKTHIVDFAKAEDGYNFKNKSLIDESRFEEFQKDLFENIRTNRQELMEERVLNSLIKLINENKYESKNEITIVTIKSKIETLEEEWKQEEKKFISKIEIIQDFFTNNQKILRIIDTPKEANQKVDDGWELKETLSEVKSRDYPNINLNITTGDKETKIIKEIEDKVDEENKKFHKKLDSVNMFNNFVAKSVQGENTIETLIDQFNKLRNDIQLNNFKLEIDLEKKCSTININADEIYNNIKNVWNILSLINFNNNQIEKLKKDTSAEIQKSAIKMVEDFSEVLKNDIKIQFDSYNKYLEEKKNEVKETLRKKRKLEEDKLALTKILVQQIKDFLEELQHIVNNY